MENLELLLPVLILFLAFLLKLTIDKSVEIPNLIKALYELPVDIIFLALSFLAAHAISLSTSKVKALICCLGIVIISIINVLVWSLSTKLYYKSYFKTSVALTAFNYFSTVFILYLVIDRFLVLIK